MTPDQEKTKLCLDVMNLNLNLGDRISHCTVVYEDGAVTWWRVRFTLGSGRVIDFVGPQGLAEAKAFVLGMILDAEMSGVV